MSGIPLSRRHGFTIVELLVAIIVIGILATIAVVSYNGAQDRARSARIISQAKAYVNGIQFWETKEGRPTTDSCIAPASAVTGGVCPLAGVRANVPYDAAFNAALAEYSGVSVPVLGEFGIDSPKGLMWYHPNYYNDNRGVLYYTVSPKVDCGLPNVLSLNPGLDNLTLMGANYTDRNVNRTQCLVEVLKW